MGLFSSKNDLDVDTAKEYVHLCDKGDRSSADVRRIRDIEDAHSAAALREADRRFGR